MPKQELKDLSSEQLKKRQRFAGFVMGFSIGLMIVLTITALTIPNYTLLAIVPAILVTNLPMYLGLKKVKLELKNREDAVETSSSSDNSKKTTGFWIMSSCLSLILILNLYTIIVSGEVKLQQFALFATVSALSVSLFKEIPSLSKIKYLKPMMITLAILIVGLGIYTEWINK